MKKTLYIFVRFKAYSGTVVTFKKNDTLKQVGEHVHQRRQRVFIFIFFLCETLRRFEKRRRKKKMSWTCWIQIGKERLRHALADRIQMREKRARARHRFPTNHHVAFPGRRKKKIFTHSFYYFSLGFHPPPLKKKNMVEGWKWSHKKKLYHLGDKIHAHKDANISCHECVNIEDIYLPLFF